MNNAKYLDLTEFLRGLKANDLERWVGNRLSAKDNRAYTENPDQETAGTVIAELLCELDKKDQLYTSLTDALEKYGKNELFSKINVKESPSDELKAEFRRFCHILEFSKPKELENIARTLLTYLSNGHSEKIQKILPDIVRCYYSLDIKGDGELETWKRLSNVEIAAGYAALAMARLDPSLREFNTVIVKLWERKFDGSAWKSNVPMVMFQGYEGIDDPSVYADLSTKIAECRYKDEIMEEMQQDVDLKDISAKLLLEQPLPIVPLSNYEIFKNLRQSAQLLSVSRPINKYLLSLKTIWRFLQKLIIDNIFKGTAHDKKITTPIILLSHKDENYIKLKIGQNVFAPADSFVFVKGFGTTFTDSLGLHIFLLRRLRDSHDSYTLMAEQENKILEILEILESIKNIERHSEFKHRSFGREREATKIINPAIIPITVPFESIQERAGILPVKVRLYRPCSPHGTLPMGKYNSDRGNIFQGKFENPGVVWNEQGPKHSDIKPIKLEQIHP